MSFLGSGMNLAAIRNRIAYERTFSLAERWERRKEKVAIWLARRLPQRLRMWVIVCRHADVTRGDAHPDSVSAFDLTRGMCR